MGKARAVWTAPADNLYTVPDAEQQPDIMVLSEDKAGKLTYEYGINRTTAQMTSEAIEEANSKPAVERAQLIIDSLQNALLRAALKSGADRTLKEGFGKLSGLLSRFTLAIQTSHRFSPWQTQPVPGKEGRLMGIIHQLPTL